MALKIKTREKLNKLDTSKTIDKSEVKREELNLENKVYGDKLEDGEDKVYIKNLYEQCLTPAAQMASLRHKIAGDVVMLSHLAMKLYYVR